MWVVIHSLYLSKVRHQGAPWFGQTHRAERDGAEIRTQGECKTVLVLPHENSLKKLQSLKKKTKIFLNTSVLNKPHDSGYIFFWNDFTAMYISLILLKHFDD